MAKTFVAIPDDSLLPGKPGRSVDMLQMRDNLEAVAGLAPTAAAAGVANAAAWHPYNISSGGDGVIYDFSVDGLVALITSPNFEGGFDYQFIFEALSNDTAAAELKAAAYRDLDGVYTNPLTISPSASIGAVRRGAMTLLNPLYVSSEHRGSVEMVVTNSTAGDANYLPAFVGFAFTNAVSQGLRNVQFTSSGGESFDKGKIIMLRRGRY